MTLLAKKDIKEGEEIFVSYIVADGKETAERKSELKSVYKFNCRCSKCSAEQMIPVHNEELTSDVPLAA